MVKKWDERERIVLSDSGRGQLAGCCGNGHEPPGYVKYGDLLTSCGTASFSRRALPHVVGWLVSWVVN
jgi:hypothetical protein